MWVEVAKVVLPALLAFLGAWGGLRVELQWLRADVNRAHQRIDVLEQLRLKGSL